MKIFDSLSHIKKNSNWYNTVHDASLNRLLLQFEKGLTKTLLVGMPGDDINYLIEVSNQYSEQIIPIAPIEYTQYTSLGELEKQILNYKNLGFKGIKIHPRFLNTNLADSKIIEIIKLSGKYNLVSLLCTLHRFPSKPLRRPIHDMLHEICDETKDSKTILLHGGYFDVLATSEMIRGYDNVLLDLSKTIIRFQETSIINDIRFLFKTFDNRICIGSDFPEHTIYDVLNVIENNNLDKIEIEKLEKIYFKNLEQFFGFNND